MKDIKKEKKKRRKKKNMETGVLGGKRIEYLDLANKAWASNQYDMANKMLDNFLATVTDDSSLAKKIKEEFDKIEKKRLDTWNSAVKETDSMDSWTQTEVRGDSRIALTLEVLHDKIDSCWKLCISQGGFYD
jgi:hypothetical protein